MIFQLVESPFARIVKALLPDDARVAVVGEVDDALFGLPETASSLSEKADDDEAVARLEELERTGAEFLVIPQSAFGWLGQRKRFAGDLASRYRLVTRHQNAGEIYQLVPAGDRDQGGQQPEGPGHAPPAVSRARKRIFRLLSRE